MPVYWFPVKRMTLYSPLSLDDAVKLLSDQVFQRRLIRWGIRDAGTFEGKVSFRGFDINRVLAYRNSWQPVIYGKFREQDKGIQIDVLVTIHPIVLVITVGILVVLCPMIFGINQLSIFISNAFTSTAKFQDFLAFLGVFGCIPYVLVMLSFSYEANKDVEFLNGVFRTGKRPSNE